MPLAEQGGAVLYAIAAGASKYSEIQGTVGFDPLRALDRLQEARLVTRLVPAGEDPRKSRRAIYRVADNFLASYLGPVLRHRTEIERGRGRTVIPAIERELDRHLGLPYEEAFRECLWRKADDRSLGLEDIVEIGPWWGTAKAASITRDVDQLRYIICARTEVITPEGSDTITITARDIFPDPS